MDQDSVTAAIAVIDKQLPDPVLPLLQAAMTDDAFAGLRDEFLALGCPITDPETARYIAYGVLSAFNRMAILPMPMTVLLNIALELRLLQAVISEEYKPLTIDELTSLSSLRVVDDAHRARKRWWRR